MQRTGFAAIVFAALIVCSNVARGETPVVFWASDPIGPNETALLFGDGLGPNTSAEGWMLPDEPVSAPPATPATFALTHGQRLEVLQASPLCAKVLLPATWKPGMYAVRLRTSAGQSAPVYLNRTEVWWWLGEPGHVAAPGGDIRVFGKNLGSSVVAWLAGHGKVTALPNITFKAGDALDYQATFYVTPDTPAGDYQLWVHNGHGGPLGFSRPLAVHVAQPDAWPTTRFDVVACGAVGDGVADDTAALAAALAKAGAAGGGVVYVPSGRYKITAKLVVPPKTVLRGEKRELVWLIVPKELAEIDAVLAGDGDFAVEDLSIVSQTAKRLIVCPDYKTVYDKPWGRVPEDHLGHNAHLRRLRLHHLRYAHRIQGKDDPRRQEEVGPSTVLLAGPDMELSDCEVVSPGMPLVLIDALHGAISRNRLDTGRNGWYGIWGAEETVFEDNEIQGRDLEGSYGGVQGKAARMLFAGNHFHDAYGDEREALTFDTPYHPTWMGRAASAVGTTLVTAEYDGRPKTWKPGALAGQACMIAFGKGLGQYLRIADNTETALTLAEPWAVAPDATSHVVVRPDKSQVVIAGNTFSDASAAVQLYAQSFGFIIDNNGAERTGGMYGIGWDAIDQRQRRRYSTCCFNQWLNNTLTEGFIYQQGAFANGVMGPCAAGGKLDPPTVVAIGNIVRNNHLEDHQTIGAMYFAPHPLNVPKSSAGYFGRDTILENNKITDTDVAIDVYPRYLDTLLRNNTVDGTALPLRDDGQDTWIAPGERLGYQYQAARYALGDAFQPKDFANAIHSLQSQPAGSPEAAARASKLQQRLWQDVAAQHAQGNTPALLAALAGLHFELAPNYAATEAIGSGKGGKAEITIHARTEPWSPELELAVQLVSPSSWSAAGDVKRVIAKPAVPVDLTAQVQIPAQVDTQRAIVRITATLAGTSLSCDVPYDVSDREILHWVVLGPLPNSSGALPDATVHPAEKKFEPRKTYDGLAGNVAWQPLTLPNRFLHFDQLWKLRQPATALAVACLRVEQPTRAMLQLHCRGTAELSLGGVSIVKVDPPSGSRTVGIELRPGDNRLVCKSSFLSGPWEIAVDVKPLTPGLTITQVPAAELRGR